MTQPTSIQQYAPYPAYRPSGIDWIGDVPEGWEVLIGKYFFSIVNERSKDGQEELLTVSEHHGIKKRSESNVTMFMAESYQGYKICHPNDLVINSLWAWSRGLGFSKLKGIVSTAYSVFRPNQEKVFPDFLNYLLRTDRYVAQYLIASKGIWISRLQLSDWAFLRLPVSLPPLPTQRAIAAFLDDKTGKIDAAIAQKEQLIALLKERKQIIIQEAVTGKKVWNEAQQAWTAPTATKPSGVDWIGEIPEGWEVKANRCLFRERNESGIDELPILSVSIHSAVSTEEQDEDVNIRAKVRIADKSSYKLVFVDDIVFNMMRAWQGAIGAVKVRGLVSPAYIVAAPRNAIVPSFFEYQYRSPDFILQMDRVSKGITDFRKRLYWNEFKQLHTIIPPLGEQTIIVEQIEITSSQIDRAISLQEEQIGKLKEYKTVLIDAAVTGKIKVE